MYRELNINQRITLKGLISIEKERSCIGIYNNNYFDALRCLRIWHSWEEIINFFLSDGDTSFLKLNVAPLSEVEKSSEQKEYEKNQGNSGYSISSDGNF